MEKRTKSIFEWACIILIALLLALIIVQIFMFTAKKQRQDDLNRKIDNIPEVTENFTPTLIEQLENFDYKIVVDKF